MDPTVLIAGLSATLQAIQTWIQYKDRGRAITEFDQAVVNIDIDVLAQSRHLNIIIPPDVLDDLTERVKRCWTRYREVLKDTSGYLPADVDDATLAVKRCVMRELTRIYDLNNGVIPDGILKKWWIAYAPIIAP